MTTSVTEGARRERSSFIAAPQHSRGRALPLLRDWSKSMGGGGGGPEHLEMWLVKNT